MDRDGNGFGNDWAEANTSWRGTNEGHQMKADYGWNNDGAGTNQAVFVFGGGYSYGDGR